MKVFISQPMRGKTDEFIKSERETAVQMIMDRFSDAEIIDSYFGDFDGNAVQFLGKSIQKLGEADLAVFLSGWDSARGCKIEERICQKYDIKTGYINDGDWVDRGH